MQHSLSHCIYKQCVGIGCCFHAIPLYLLLSMRRVIFVFVAFEANRTKKKHTIENVSVK